MPFPSHTLENDPVHQLYQLISLSRILVSAAFANYR